MPFVSGLLFIALRVVGLLN